MSEPLTLGLMMAELEESHRPKLEQVMERFAHLKEFWVLVCCFWLGNELHRRFLVFSKPPLQEKYKSPFQGTICYYRKNSWGDGKIKRIWVLLPDFPIPDRVFIDGTEASPHLEDDARRWRVPVIY